MSQQSFTELPLPRKTEVTVVMRVASLADPDYCAKNGCSNNTIAGKYEWDITQCDCCGQWFCREHIKRESSWGDFCPSCMAFTKPVRAAIMDFRKQLSELI